MDLDDDEMRANQKKSQNEKVLDSLDNMISKLERIINPDDPFDYWIKESYCLAILKKIKRGEIAK